MGIQERGKVALSGLHLLKFTFNVGERGLLGPLIQPRKTQTRPDLEGQIRCPVPGVMPIVWRNHKGCWGNTGMRVANQRDEVRGQGWGRTSNRGVHGDDGGD